MHTHTLPVLYSLRQCPYAMRARLSPLLAGQDVLLRDVVMGIKPSEMLDASPKGYDKSASMARLTGRLDIHLSKEIKPLTDMVDQQRVTTCD